MVISLIISLLSLLCLSRSQNCSINYCQNCSNESVCTTCMAGFDTDANQTICYLIDSCSQPACVNCINDTCTMCLEGYSMHSSRVCTKCPMNCIQCTENGECLLCNVYYVLQNEICSQSQYQSCPISYNFYICLLCQKAEYNNNNLGSCSSCLNNCLYCTNSSNCFLCQNGYYLSVSSKGKTICNPCNPQCANCYGSPANCTLCNSDSYLINNQCLPCISVLPFCVTCVLPINSSVPVCSSCFADMFVSTNGSCSRCPEGCLACTSATGCSACEVMFFLNNQNLCQPCGIENCLTCSNNENCTNCQATFYQAFSPDRTTCGQCSPNCLSCLAPGKCLGCQNGYIVNKTSGKCVPCIPNCITCHSLFTCTIVPINIYFSFHLQYKLLVCPNYCPNCKQDSNGLFRCFYCFPGSYLVNSSVCAVCPVDNCYDCNTTYSTNSCALCNSGFYLTKQGQCNQCSQGCGICQNNSSCLSCADGYFNQSGQCIVCLVGCNSCNFTLCFSCAEGFFLSSQSQCQSCPNGCLSCVAENICNMCLSGFFLLSPSSSSSQSYSQICSPCIQPCSVCSSNSTCVICQRGFTLNSFGSCSPCPNNFANCERGYEQKCLDKFTLVVNSVNSINEISAECVACPTKCEQCKYEYKSKSFACLSCSLGYILTITGECFQCGATSSTTGCFTCSSSGSCDSCLSGFTLKNGVCNSLYYEPDSEWPLIGANIGLSCLSMILIIALLIQRNQSTTKPSSIHVELAEMK